jgi:hypothetical protein
MKKQQIKTDLEPEIKTVFQPYNNIHNCLVYVRVSSKRQTEAEKKKKARKYGYDYEDEHDNEDKQKKLIDDFFSDPKYKGKYKYVGNQWQGKKIFYRDVASGSSWRKRPSFRQMVRDLMTHVNGANTGIVCYRDRVGREPIRYMKTLLDLALAGSVILVIGEDGEPRNIAGVGNTEIRDQNDQTISLITEVYSATSSSSTIDRYSAQARNNTMAWHKAGINYTGGKPKFGYLVRGKRYFIKPKEAEVVRSIWSLYAEGKGVVAIRNAIGYDVRRPKKERAVYRTDFIAYVLRQDAYATGEYRFRQVNNTFALKRIDNAAYEANPDITKFPLEKKREIIMENSHLIGVSRTEIGKNFDIPVSGVYPIIVDDKNVVDAVHKRLEKNRRRDRKSRKERVFIERSVAAQNECSGILSGLLVCGSCGSWYYRGGLSELDPKTKQVVRDGFYKCGSYKTKKKCDNQQTVSYGIDNAVFSAVAQIVFSPEYHDRMVEMIADAKKAATSRRAGIKADPVALKVELSDLYVKRDALTMRVASDHAHKDATREAQDKAEYEENENAIEAKLGEIQMAEEGTSAEITPQNVLAPAQLALYESFAKSVNGEVVDRSKMTEPEKAELDRLIKQNSDQEWARTHQREFLNLFVEKIVYYHRYDMKATIKQRREVFKGHARIRIFFKGFKDDRFNKMRAIYRGPDGVWYAKTPHQKISVPTTDHAGTWNDRKRAEKRDEKTGETISEIQNGLWLGQNRD